MDKGPSSYPPTYEQSQGISSPSYPPNNPGYPPMNPNISLYPAIDSEQTGSMPVPYPNKMGFSTDNNPGYPTTNAPPTQVPLTSVREHGAPVNPVPPQNIVTATAGQPVLLGPHAATMACPHCKETVTTTVKTHPSLAAWGICAIMSIVGCFCGCCLIPFFIQQLKNIEHFCPKCNNYLGKYETSRRRRRRRR